VSVDVQRDLKIDQVRMPVGAEKYIASLIHIEVNDVASVDAAEQLEELVKEIIGQVFELF
jgi:hypothetical protein